MATLHDRIIAVLEGTGVAGISNLIRYMKGEKGYFWVRSHGHDHWTNGTAQHSWRVYQYMLYMKEHPEEIPPVRKAKREGTPVEEELLPERVRSLVDTDIALAGLLHDLGKTKKAGQGYPHGHEKRSKTIIDMVIGDSFAKQYPNVMGAIYYHHGYEKHDAELDKYKDSTLARLLKQADCIASGTTWNSTRFKEGRTQRKGEQTNDVLSLRRDALDRTYQMLSYRMFVDCEYNLHPIVGFGGSTIEWNAKEDVVRQIKGGQASCLVMPDGSDVISSAHQLVKDGNSVCMAIGIENNVIDSWDRYLRQNNSSEEDLLICSNILNSFYSSKYISHHRYSYIMRKEIKQQYIQQDPSKGVFLPDVTFFRDGASEGFRQVAPWRCDVLLIPGWKGAVIIEK